MGRPRNNRCRECRNPLPAEEARDELTIGTDVCQRCAQVTLAGICKTKAAREWYAAWRDKLRTVMQLREPSR